MRFTRRKSYDEAVKDISLPKIFFMAELQKFPADEHRTLLRLLESRHLATPAEVK